MKKDFQVHTEHYWVPEFNLMPEIQDKLNIPDKVKIYELCLREGDQTPGVVLRAEEKIAMARELDKYGVYDIEIFPAVSQDDFEALKEISSWQDRKFETSGLARFVVNDIDRVAEAGADRVMIEGPMSLAIASHMLGITDENKIIAKFVDSVKYAQSLGLKVSAEPWDIGKSNWNFIERFYKTLADTGIDQAIFADTYNNLMPWTVYAMVKQIYAWTENQMIIVPHFHNDYGMALASTMAAVAAGSTIIHSALNSVGEKAGNTSTEEAAVVLEVLMGVETGIDLSMTDHITKKYEAISKLAIPSSKAVTGSRIHELGSGIAADMFYKSTSDYDRPIQFPFYPSLIGAQEPRIVWGKGCGAKMVTELAGKMGITLDKAQADAVRDQVKAESLLRKALLKEYEVEQMIRNIVK